LNDLTDVLRYNNSC